MKKYTTTTLIRNFFLANEPSAKALEEIKRLTKDDKLELGSAIARSMGLTADQCDFELVAY